MLKDAWHGEHVAQKATIVNPAEKHVVLESGSTVPYDRLVIAVGSVVNYFNTPGAQYCYPFYSEQDMRRLQEHIAGLLDADEQAGTRTFAIVGAGPTGCEVAYALSRVLEQKKAAGKILLLDRTPTILAPFPQNLREAVASVLNKRGVTFLLNTTVANVTPLGLDVVHEDGSKENIACLTTIWAAGSKPQSLAVTGVEKTGKGELPVRPTLQLVGHDDIFVAGDIAAAGSPKTAQAAVQQSDLVSRNLILSLKGKQLEPFSFNNRGVIIALEADTAGLFFGTLLKGFIARQVRDKYYRMQLGSYR
jgi:NADH dehydrogenase